MDKMKQLDEYFDNEAVTDASLMEDLFEDDQNETVLKESLSRKWNSLLKQPANTDDLKHILYKIHFKINANATHTENKKVLKFPRWASRVAVILFIPLLTLSILFLNREFSEQSYAEIIAPKGEKIRFELPDGSTGYLNSESILKYKSNFKRKRLVQLAGEGYFDVKKDKNPFIVDAGEIQIKVLGTKFNVNAYLKENSITTTLQSGRVQLLSKNGDIENILLPGQQGVFSKKEKTITTDEVNTDLFCSWNEQTLKFQNTSFYEVVEKMEHWYNVKIILQENLKYTESYTMTIKDESLAEMLQLMSLTTPMEYKISENKVYITNSELPMN